MGTARRGVVSVCTLDRSGTKWGIVFLGATIAREYVASGLVPSSRMLGNPQRARKLCTPYWITNTHPALQFHGH